MSRVEKVKQGEESALDVYPEIYELEKSIKELSSELKDYVIEERSKYDKKDDVIKGGYRISVVTSTRFNYKGDEHWQAIEQAKKNRETLLKKATSMAEKNQTLTDPETGEVIPPAEVKTSTYPKLEYVGDRI